MTSAITSPPNNYNFGLEFNYSLWTADTTITLVNVPFDSAYRDIVKFPDRDALNAYIDSVPESTRIAVTRVSHVKYAEPIRLDIPFNAAIRYNYLRASNPVQPISGDIQRDYYYFILDVRYVAPNTTEFILQVDYWQSFNFDVEFGNCYVEQGHIGIANQHGYRNFGRDYLTVPEGIDTGSNRVIIGGRTISLNTTLSVSDGRGSPESLEAWQRANFYMVTSAVSVTHDLGSVDDPKFPLPKKPLSDFYFMESLDVILIPYNEFPKFIDNLRANPWVAQSILNITLVPSPFRYKSMTWVDGSGVNCLTKGLSNYLRVSELKNNAYARFTIFDPGWRESVITNYIGARYAHLKKFHTAPYTYVSGVNMNGSAIEIAPETLPDKVTGLEGTTYNPGNIRTDFIVEKINTVNNSWVGATMDRAIYARDPGESSNMVLSNDHFPTIAVANDQGMALLASRAHSLSAARAGADWAQQRAMNAAATGYDQSTSAMNLASSLTDISVSAANQQTSISNLAATNATHLSNQHAFDQAGIGAIQGIANGAAGGVAGVGFGLLNGALNLYGASLTRRHNVDMLNNSNSARIQSTNVSNAAALASNSANISHSSFVRDSNRNLSEYSARGDYAQTIRAIDASVQDTLNTPPSVAGAFGGAAAAFIRGDAGFRFAIRCVDKARVRAIGEYWLRFGYRINAFLTPPASLSVMEKFTYWKFQQSYLVGSTVPESVKNVIRGIFEKGVTVWSSPGYIGTVDTGDNSPVIGKYY